VRFVENIYKETGTSPEEACKVVIAVQQNAGEANGPDADDADASTAVAAVAAGFDRSGARGRGSSVGVPPPLAKRKEDPAKS
jgi:hypothetical protein